MQKHLLELEITPCGNDTARQRIILLINYVKLIRRHRTYFKFMVTFAVLARSYVMLHVEKALLDLFNGICVQNCEMIFFNSSDKLPTLSPVMGLNSMYVSSMMVRFSKEIIKNVLRSSMDNEL